MLGLFVRASAFFPGDKELAKDIAIATLNSDMVDSVLPPEYRVTRDALMHSKQIATAPVTIPVRATKEAPKLAVKVPAKVVTKTTSYAAKTAVKAPVKSLKFLGSKVNPF